MDVGKRKVPLHFGWVSLEIFLPKIPENTLNINEKKLEKISNFPKKTNCLPKTRTWKTMFCLGYLPIQCKYGQIWYLYYRNHRGDRNRCEKKSVFHPRQPSGFFPPKSTKPSIKSLHRANLELLGATSGQLGSLNAHFLPAQFPLILINFCQSQLGLKSCFFFQFRDFEHVKGRISRTVIA